MATDEFDGRDRQQLQAPTSIIATRSSIVDGCLIAGAILSIPAAMAAYYRTTDTGWDDVQLLYFVIAAAVVVTALLRKRLPLVVRAAVVVAATSSVGIGSVATFGLASNGRFFLLASVLLATLFFGLRVGAVALAAAITSLIGTFFLSRNGYLVFPGQTDAMLTSFGAWLTSVTNMTVISVVVGIPMNILVRRLEEALSDVESARSKLMRQHETSEEFFARAFHSSPLVLTVSDASTGKFYDVNQACLDISGYSRDELLNSTSLSLGIWPKVEHRNALMDGLRKDGLVRDIDVTLRSKDGRLVDVLLTAHLIRTDQGNRVLAIGQDITRLKEVSRMKSEFISIVSHELRTPLTSIVGALKLVQSGAPALSEQRDQLLSVALKNSVRLTDLVNDLLDLDKLQSKAMIFNMEKVELASIAVEAIEHGQPFADIHDVELIMSDPRTPAIVRGDKFRLNQVVLNLLSNASKFSPPKSEVTVSVTVSDGYGRIEVADRGPGIPSSYREFLFDRFTQVDASDLRSKQGSGLGLNICKSIIEAHNGRIDFLPNENGGTVFYVDIPLWTESDEPRQEVGASPGQ